MGLKNRHSILGMEEECGESSGQGTLTLSSVGMKTRGCDRLRERGYRNRWAWPAGHPVALELNQDFSSIAFLDQKNQSYLKWRVCMCRKQVQLKRRKLINSTKELSRIPQLATITIWDIAPKLKWSFCGPRALFSHLCCEGTELDDL